MKQSDFLGFNPKKAKRHLRRCLFKNGAAEKNVRAFHYSPASGRLINSPSILRRILPALRCRTENYDDYKQLENKLEKALENMKKHIEIRFIALYPKLNNK
jgi:hypothetical protein